MRSALAENTAKLTPSPSQFAPSGSGLPGSSRSGKGGISAPLRSQDQRRQRRQDQEQRIGEAVAGDGLRGHVAAVAFVGAAVALGVRVERLLPSAARSEEHTSELQSRQYLVCRLLLEKKNTSELQSLKY